MGGSRKNKQTPLSSNPLRNSDSSAATLASNASAANNDTKEASDQLDFVRTLEEVDRVVFRITRTEIAFIFLGMILVAIVALVMTLAAEISVSVHYYDDKPAVVTLAQFGIQGRELGRIHDRITAMEPDMVAANAPHRDRVRLERVVDVTATGHQHVLLFVEESPSLHGDELVDGVRLSRVKPPATEYQELVSIKPGLCSDRKTFGFSDWDTLRRAVLEANTLSVERFVRWSRFLAEAENFTGIFDNDALYYEEDILLRICPGVTLRGSRDSIFINAPGIILECRDCTVTGGSTHLAFGPHAKHVVVRGITFRKARTSSLTFYHHGAIAEFEDCEWYDNAAVNHRFGAVVDVNSTSLVNFYRCQIGTDESSTASSLSVRT